MDELDDLLDSALDDFRRVEISHSSTKSPGNGSESTESSALPHSDLSGPSISDGYSGTTVGQGLGLGLPGLTVGKKKTTRAKGSLVPSTRNTSTEPIKGSHGNCTNMAPQRPLSATVEQLAHQTRETVGNIDVVDEDNIMGDELVENLMKQFEDLGGSQDMQSIMDTMMRQLLSKEVLHEPMKEIGDRYPEWLAANKSKLNQEDYDRYSKQHHFILQLCEVYESKPDNFQEIMDLMQSMQNCGQPPSDIVKELAPGLDLDQDGLPMLPDFSAIAAGGQPNCSIM